MNDKVHCVKSQRRSKKLCHKDSCDICMSGHLLKEHPGTNMSIQSTIRTYETCIRSIMTYAMETIAESTRMKHFLRDTL